MPAETGSSGVLTEGATARSDQGRTSNARRIRSAKTALNYLLLTFLAFIVVFPIYITFVNSLLLPEQIFRKPPAFLPTDPQWHTYPDAWRQGIGRYMFNSAVVTAAIVIGQVGTAILAGYAFAFLRFPFRQTIFVIFLATMMVPFEVTLVTNLETVTRLGWYDTYAGLAVPFLATGFGAFLLRQQFLTVPADLSDAARMDGYGHLRFLLRVAIPLARPTIAALTVFAFLGAWNQYLWPLMVTRDDRLRTVQIGLAQMQSTTAEGVNVTFAGAILASLPLLILLVIFHRQLVRGLTAGAVKG